MGGVAVDLAPLGSLVDQLAGADLSDYCDAALADSFIELRREIDRLEASAARLLRAVEVRGIAYGDGATSASAWAQWRAGQRWRDAKASVDAAAVCERMPLTHKAWAQGEISASAVRSICRGIRAGHEDMYLELEEYLVAFAANHDFRELDNVIGHYHKVCDLLDDKEPEDKNGLYLSPVGDRYALNADLDARIGALFDKALAAAMDINYFADTDPRTLAQRRADALGEIAKFYLDHNQDLPVEHGQAPHISFVIPWDELQALVPLKNVPSDPDGLAAFLSTSQKQRLLCDAYVSLIILGADGQPLNVGREQRTCNRHIRRALAIRDRGCRYPGCDRRPNRCEAHHVIPWEHGGPTSLDNLVLLCSFHHHVIHRKGWTNHLNGTGYTIHNQHGHRIE